MSNVLVPKGYQSTLGLYDTQTAIGLLKRTFEERLCLALNLKRVSAPLFVAENPEKVFRVPDNNQHFQNHMLTIAVNA